MANETRRRNDNVFGTLSSTMNSTGTTINSAGLANLEAISSTEHAVIVIDPNRTAGAPEHVIVTAHTGSATSATITRGQFGTSARAHSSTEDWVHAPIASNASSFASAANLQGDFVPMGAWESYTPSNTNVTVGNGTQTALFRRIGRTVTVKYTLIFGSTTSFSGTVAIGLPVAGVAGIIEVGAVLIIDSGTRRFCGIAYPASTTAVNVAHTESGNAGDVNATNPMTWTTNDQLRFTYTYEAAS